MALDPIVVALSGSGEATARRVASALEAPLHGRQDRVRAADVMFPDALEHIRTLFLAGHPVVGCCAAGILIRAVAPVLANKTTEPPVIAVAEDGSVVIPLLGGHHGANRLASEIATNLGGRAAVTTAGEVSLGLALDQPPPGWRLADPKPAKSAMATLLSGGGATVVGDAAPAATWLDKVPRGDAVRIEATTHAGASGQLTFHPITATLGVGAARNCPPDELLALVRRALGEADLAPQTLAGVFSLDLKADEPAVNALGAALKVPVRFFSAAALEAETPRLQNPSDVVFAEVGCHGVAEGAALAAAGPDARLAVPKIKSEHGTAAIALSSERITTVAGSPRGHLSIVGIGPGQAGWRTPEASQLVAQADELVGYGLYLDLLGHLAKAKARVEFALGEEEARCRYAIEAAAKGRRIALISSGDAGIYAMAALVYELLDRPQDAGGVSDAARRIEVQTTPGISALQAAAARIGAPLGHDFCAISLSDLLTPREDILRRVRAAAEGDFVIAFYNPVSRRRRTLLDEAREILLGKRPGHTPVCLAASLGRPDEAVRLTRLDALTVDEVDMLTTVIIGSSQSRAVALGDGPRMYTPRGYAKKREAE